MYKGWLKSMKRFLKSRKLNQTVQKCLKSNLFNRLRLIWTMNSTISTNHKRWELILRKLIFLRSQRFWLCRRKTRCRCTKRSRMIRSFKRIQYMLKTVPLFDHHAPIITRHNLDSKHQSIFTKSLNLEILASKKWTEKWESSWWNTTSSLKAQAFSWHHQRQTPNTYQSWLLGNWT